MWHENEKQPEEQNRIQPLPVLLLFLTLTTGLLDAVSFLGLGRVFTANMTGNVVFLGFAISGAPGVPVLSSLTAIAAFLVGAGLGGRAGKSYAGEKQQNWFLTVAFVESVLLISAGIVALDFDIETHSSAIQLYFVIVLTAVAMGLRNATVRQINVKDMTTTVLTMSLTGIGADSSPAGGKNQNLARRAGSVFLMFTGAAIGAFMLYETGSLSIPLFVCGGTVLIVTLVYAALPASQAENAAPGEVKAK